MHDAANVYVLWVTTTSFELAHSYVGVTYAVLVDMQNFTFASSLFKLQPVDIVLMFPMFNGMYALSPTTLLCLFFLFVINFLCSALHLRSSHPH